MKTKIHNIDNRARVVKYVINRAKGLNKKESAISAGYSEKHNTVAIEKTKGYQEVVKTYFKDKLMEQSSLEELSSELLKNIRQDQDRGAKNTAIKMALDKIEPEEHIEQEEDRVMVILRPTIEAEAKLIDPTSTPPAV